MKNLIWVVIAVAVAVVGYVVLGPKETAEIVPDSVTVPDVAAEVEAVVTDVVEGAQAVATDAEEAVEEAADVVTTEVEAAVSEATDAVEAQVEAVTEQVDAVTEQADTMSEEAVDTAGTAVEEAASSASDMASLFTVAGFDLDKVSGLIDSSTLGELQKTTLKTGLESAQNNPEVLTQVLGQAKSALGL